jgi:hypothetical protein
MMREINNRFVSGLNGNWQDGILIKIGSDNSLFFTNKNVPVKKGENELVVINDIIPDEKNGEKIEFISQIKLEINLEKAIFLQPKSLFHVLFIKKDNYREIFVNSLIGKEISIYFYFVDPLLSYVDFGDMLLIQKGHVDSIAVQDNIFLRIECSIGDLLINEKIPDIILNKSDYPCLPDSSTGKSIPSLYGRFSATKVEKEEFDLAPAVKVDDFENIYLASSVELMNYTNIYYFYNSAIDRYTKIISAIEFSNSNPVSIRHDFTVTCEALFRLKQRGSQMTPGLVDRYINYIHNSSALLFLLNSNEALYLADDDFGDPGDVEYYYEGSNYGNIKLCVSLGNAVNGLNGIAAKIIYYMNNNFYYIPGNDLTQSNSNSTIEILIEIPPDDYFRNLKSMEFGIVVEPSGSIEFKNMYTKIKFLR